MEHPELVPMDALDEGTPAVLHRQVTDAEAVRASRRWWNYDAETYLAEHGADLGDVDFLWCPEGLREDDAQLLGPTDELKGRRILEVGCGSAPVARWLADQGAEVVGLDLSDGMLARAAQIGRRVGLEVPLVQADAGRLPFQDDSFDLACSAFGAVPFVADSAALMAEVARVLRPGGRWVFSVTHPLRWIFADDPGPDGLHVQSSYFDRTPYVELDGRGVPSYVETHRTLGDRIREIVGAGFVLTDLLEPEWTPGRTTVWGQWSPFRGALLPGTAIYVCDLPGVGLSAVE